jgi:hypothetical protein
MSTIHNGFIDKRFRDSFKDTDLNDVDIATTKMYKGVKPMWQQLGFVPEDQNINPYDNPDHKLYWQNIIPKHYKFTSQHIDGILESFVSSGSAIDGSKIPRTSYWKILIDEVSTQSWRGLNPKTNNKLYYYPELPSLDKFGNFTNNFAPGSKFYGGKITWDGPDDSAPITNLNEQDNNLILNIDFDQTTTDDLIDKTNLSKIHYNQDFQVSLSDDLRLKTDTLIIPDGIEKNNSEQAF